MNKIKILMVAGAMDVGGIESQLMHLLRNADKNKFQIDFTSTMPNAAHREEIEALGGKFIIIPDMNWSKPWNYICSLYRVIKNGEYDIVHSHELFHSGITLWIANLAGIPCRFVHAHNWCDNDGTGRKTSVIRLLYNAVMQKAINRYSTIQIACSSWAGKFLYGEKKTLSDTYRLVFNSVNTSKYIDNYYNAESGEFCNDVWINILNVARITEVKNQGFLIKIAEEFRSRGRKIRFLCAGSGDKEYETKIKALIREKGLDDYIQLLGVRKDVDILTRKCSVFVLPSKYEGMPLVMIEAQASGMPCVSADTYSPEVDFDIGQVEWLSLNASVPDWADALERAVNKGRADKESVEKAIFSKKFDSRMFTETLCNLYEQDYKRRVVND